MKQSKLRQLALSIAIVSMMLSATLLSQDAGAATTVGGTAEKSITLTAGADGRAFAQINDTYNYQAIQAVDYNHPFTLYDIDYGHDYGAADYSYATGRSDVGPWRSYESSYDPDTFYGTGPLSPYIKVPHFLMTHNLTSDVVSPTITLSARNLTLFIGTTTEFQLDSFNTLVAALRITAAEQNKVIVFTGQTTGSAVYFYIYNPDHVYQDSFAVDYTGYFGDPAGYFAFPFLANIVGDYMIYVEADNAYVKLTPTVVEGTDMQVGQFASGEVNIPASLPSELPVYTIDREPSQIVALSYSVSAGDEYAFSFSSIEQLASLFGAAPSDAYCWYFDVAMKEDGTPNQGLLLDAGSPEGVQVSLKAPVSGTLYIVLVANYMSWFKYSMGVEAVTIPTAPLNEPFQVQLYTPTGLDFQLYEFTLTAETMVRMNYTQYSGDILASIAKLTSSGIVYSTDMEDLSVNSYIISGAAESNLESILHLDAGTYLLAFVATSSPSRAKIEINTYPISDYSYGSPLDMDVYTTKALAVSITDAQVFDYWAFNVSLISPQKNASIVYRMVLYNEFNQPLNYTDCRALDMGHVGIGNKKYDTGWQGIPLGAPAPTHYHVEGTGSSRYFRGNTTAGACPFLSTYAGRYFLVLDLLNGYNTTTPGTTTAVGTRWNYTKAPTMSLSIQLVQANYTLMIGKMLQSVTKTSIDSSSGAGSTKVNYGYTATPVNATILLSLTPQVNTWTRISVSILNGTRQDYEWIFDKIRDGWGTFDPYEGENLWPSYKSDLNIYGFYNTTYIIEFASILPTMMIEFFIDLPGTQNHTVVSFNVEHFYTPAFSGLTPASKSATGGLVVHVVDSSGAAIADANVVSISQPAGQAALSGLTNSTGHVVFSNVLAGVYNLNASMTGYNSNSSVSVTVATDVTASTEVSLSAIVVQPAFPIEILLIIIIAIVAVVLIIAFVAIRKKSKGRA